MEVYDNYPKTKEPLSVGQWILTLFLLSLPIVNIVMLFVWAFGWHKDERENFAKASLLWIVIGFIFVFLIIGCVGFAGMATLFNNY